MEDSSVNGNQEEVWAEQQEYNEHGFTLTVKLDVQKNVFVITVVLNGAKIEVSRSYNAFYELNEYLRTSIEFSNYVETLPELPSSEAAHANFMVLENWLELVRAHLGEHLWQCRRVLCFLDDTMETPNLKDCQLSILRRKMTELTVAYRMLSMKLYNNEGALNDLVERLMYLEAQQNSINHHHQQQQLQQHEDQHRYHHHQQQYLQQQHIPSQLTSLGSNHDSTSLSLVTGILGDILVGIEDKAGVASTATSANDCRNVDSNGVTGVANGIHDTNGVHVNDIDYTSSVCDGPSGDTPVNDQHDVDVETKVKDSVGGVGERVTAPSQMSQSNLTAPSQTIAEVVVVPAMPAITTSTTTTTPTTPTTTTSPIESATEAAAAAATAATTTAAATAAATTTTGTVVTGTKDQDKGSDRTICLMDRAKAALNTR